MVAVAQPTVLISGAGVAGPSLALWLIRNGYRVIVVEIAKGIRPGGQTVDLRGAGGDVVERMGLIGEMMTRTYFESQGKRAYLVRNALNFENNDEKRQAA